MISHLKKLTNLHEEMFLNPPCNIHLQIIWKRPFKNGLVLHHKHTISWSEA
jgi:hypothetical protein